MCTGCGEPILVEPRRPEWTKCAACTLAPKAAREAAARKKHMLAAVKGKRGAHG